MEHCNNVFVAKGKKIVFYKDYESGVQLYLVLNRRWWQCDHADLSWDRRGLHVVMCYHLVRVCDALCGAFLLYSFISGLPLSAISGYRGMVLIPFSTCYLYLVVFPITCWVGFHKPTPLFTLLIRRLTIPVVKEIHSLMLLISPPVSLF